MRIKFKDFLSLLPRIQTITKSCWHCLQSTPRATNHFSPPPRTPLGCKLWAPLPWITAGASWWTSLLLPCQPSAHSLSTFTNISKISSVSSSKSCKDLTPFRAQARGMAMTEMTLHTWPCPHFFPDISSVFSPWYTSLQCLCCPRCPGNERDPSLPQNACICSPRYQGSALPITHVTRPQLLHIFLQNVISVESSVITLFNSTPQPSFPPSLIFFHHGHTVYYPLFCFLLTC